MRARDDYALASPIVLAPRGAGAPHVVAYGAELLVVDPQRGDPLRRVRLPDGATGATAFAAVVAGRQVTGVVLSTPLRIVLF